MRLAVVVGLAVLCAACGPSETGSSTAAQAQPVTITVYSARNEQLIGPLLKQYQEASGVRTQLVTGEAGPLLERLKAEGAQTPADLLLTVDAGNLWQAAESGLLRGLQSPALDAAIPTHLRDADHRWYALSVRARTIVHHPQRAPAAQLQGYADLADPRWSGRLCLRSSAKVYNQSLVAMLIAEHGPERTEEIVRGWVKNLAAPPFSNDTAVIEAIAAGQCDVGIVNTYYYGRLQREQPDLQAALFWPDQHSSGVHVNVSGGGVTTHASHPDAAQQLLEWLASPAAQSRFAGDNLEYPANPAVEPVAAVAAWGRFQANDLPVAEAGQRQAEAVRLMDRAGYR